MSDTLMTQTINPYDENASLEEMLNYIRNQKSALNFAEQKMTKIRNLRIFEMSKKLNELINKTPTGEHRNDLCDLKIMLEGIGETLT